MFCPNCGTKIEEDGAKFCPNCGTKLDMESEVQHSESENNENLKADMNFQNHTDNKNSMSFSKHPKVKSEKKYLSKKEIVILAAAGAVVLISAGVLSNRKTTLDMNDFYDVEIKGYNGYGSVDVNFDSDKFNEKYKNKLSLNKKNAKKWTKEQYSDAEEAKDAYEALCEYSDSTEYITYLLEYSYDVYAASGGGLKNGDPIEFKYGDQESLDTIEELYNCKFKKLKEQKVKGLEDVQDYDPFADIKISFSGTEPNGTVEVEKPDDFVSGILQYNVENNGHFSNGDTAEITVSSFDDYSIEENRGAHLTRTTYEIEVDGLSSYVSSASQLTDEALDTMKKAVDEFYEEKNETSDERGNRTLEAQYIGNYIAVNNEYVQFWDSYRTAVYLCYHVDIIPPQGSEDEVYTYYTYFRFDDLLKEGDGSISLDSSEYSRPNHSLSVKFEDETGKTIKTTCKGFETLDSMHEACVASKDESYSTEVNVTDVPAKEKTGNSSNAAENTNEVSENQNNNGEASEKKTDNTEAKTETTAAAEPQTRETDTTDTTPVTATRENTALRNDFYKNGQITGTSEDYIILDSLDRYLTYDDIANLSAKGLSFARNEMMARMGRGFKNQELADYFNSMPWYAQSKSPEDFDSTVTLPDIVQANSDLMLAEEKKMGMYIE